MIHMVTETPNTPAHTHLIHLSNRAVQLGNFKRIHDPLTLISRASSERLILARCHPLTL